MRRALNLNVKIKGDVLSMFFTIGGASPLLYFLQNVAMFYIIR